MYARNVRVRAKLKRVQVDARGYEILPARQLGYYVGEPTQPVWRAELTQKPIGLPKQVMFPVEVNASSRKEAIEAARAEYNAMGVDPVMR